MHRGNIEVALAALTFMLPDSLDFNYSLKRYPFILRVHVGLPKINCSYIWHLPKDQQSQITVFLFKICCDNHDKHMDSNSLTSRMLICFTSSERPD